jgi:hypothetical protein
MLTAPTRIVPSLAPRARDRRLGIDPLRRNAHSPTKCSGMPLLSDFLQCLLVFRRQTRLVSIKVYVSGVRRNLDHLDKPLRGCSDGPLPS